MIQPLAYCLGLARAAVEAGARLHERTPARRVSHVAGEGWRVETSRGVITAKALVLATNAYHSGVGGLPPPAFTPVGYFQIATAPLSDNLRAMILPGGEGCWDAAKVMSSFRMDAEGRLLVGGVGSLDHAGRGAHRAWALRKLAAWFPALSEQKAEHCWFGRIAMTSDHLPKIVRLGPSGFAAFGYSGRGIGPGTVFGAALAEAATGAGEEALPLEPVAAYEERFTGWKRRYFELGAAATHMCSARGRWF